MEDIKSLIRRRGGKKQKLTLFKAYLKGFSSDHVYTQQEVLECEERIEKLGEVYNEFNDIQKEIEELSSDKELEQVYAESGTFESDYFLSVSTAKCIIKNFNEAKISSSSACGVSSDIVNNAGNESMSGVSNNIKLPTIQLPKFGGNYEQWVEFRDTFHSIVHGNTILSDIQKLHYLKASLYGQAAQIIHSLEISENNYAVAWKLVCERYDNKKFLINNHIRALFGIPQMKIESANELRKLTDSFWKHLLSLEALNQPVKHWDSLIIHMIVSKLDIQTRKEWEESQLHKESPTVDDMKTFLKGKCEVLETLDCQFKKQFNKFKINADVTSLSVISNDSENKCNFCQQKGHTIYKCDNFLKLNSKQRTEEVKLKRLCFNCLKRNHFSFKCNAQACKKCKRKHNTLLHVEGDILNNVSTRDDSAENIGLTNVNCGSIQEQNVLLATAMVGVKSADNSHIVCRALLDCGSEGCFITKEVCEKLNLKLHKIDLTVTGINQSHSNIHFRTDIELKSRFNSFSRKVSCFVTNNITANIPNKTFEISNFVIPSDIILADPYFYKSGKIDILLGANIFWDLLTPTYIKYSDNQPRLQKTQLGWIMTGPFLSQISNNGISCNHVTNTQIQNQIQKFWEIEECQDNTSLLKKEEQYCEEYFERTTQKDESGRFVVSIPFKSEVKLGNTVDMAMQRFQKLEARLQTNNEMKKQYTLFMKEYEELGHMTHLEVPSSGMDESYYMPHHGVFKETSSTTKLRVVFDASAKSSNGLSLNDFQYKGPVIQEELFNILLRFRTYDVVISADIEKMYRQIMISSDQRNYQRIVWRENPTDELQHFVLNTVTYGTTAAPYLAIRTLQQVAHDNHKKFPELRQIILQDFYVDDLLTGTKNIQEAEELYEKLNTILASAGFHLRKWISNRRELNIRFDNNTKSDPLTLGGNKHRMLGLMWDPGLDVLLYDIKGVLERPDNTKREMLSTIARIFDPLGLIGPCVIRAKIVLQELWTHKLGWDDKLPKELHRRWNELKLDFKGLLEIKVPRLVINCSSDVIELHAFSDASMVAYGSCVYLRSISKDNITVNLICAKSKVAPIHKTTIPRLELCGALLSARLVKKIITCLRIEIHECFFWCDSTIVISWLQTNPLNLKPFVANRVGEIQELTRKSKWLHVGTRDNPADLISRGVSSSKLHGKWWSGPDWLSMPNDEWVLSPYQETMVEIPEMKTSSIATSCVNTQEETFPFNYTSSLIKLKRITAWCLRFINNCKGKLHKRGSLSVEELNLAMKRLVKLSQLECFSNELRHLKSGKGVVHSNFSRLSPFIDDEELIRVGGRLQNSTFHFNKQHPLLISGNHRLSKLIIEYEHVKAMHAGPQLTLAMIRENFWIIGGRKSVRSILRKCVNCFKVKPNTCEQIMGQLPRVRLTSMYPFWATGVDYAGPFTIKRNKGKCKTFLKCYVSLFVCMSTKAIHLEPVTELTTQAFVATFRRFIARRGKPAHIYSDNGTNFVGAASLLKQILNQTRDSLNSVMTNEGINWSFIPAASPHFGGLWEAGVKSVKHHLRRVLGNATVVFEDFLTILAQVEAILNSRPLCPLSSDPNDLQPLTPSHFLIGRHSENIPDPDLTQTFSNRLTKYQHLQQIQQHFWKRWSIEYIGQLQERTKWLKKSRNVQIGDLVILKEDNLPPLRWKMGRITNLYPGGDGAVRVVSIKTTNGEVKRGITKICVLPLPERE